MLFRHWVVLDKLTNSSAIFASLDKKAFNFCRVMRFKFDTFRKL